MPKFKRYEINKQFDHFSLWQGLAYLIPKDDPLRMEVYGMYQKNLNIFYNGEGLSGQSAEKEDIGSKDLWLEEETLDTEDSGFQAYCNEELTLLKRVEDAYGEKPGQEGKGSHSLMMAYLDYIRLQTESLQKGVPMQTSVVETLFGGGSGLTKMRDVLFDLEPEDTSAEDPIQGNYPDPEVYESAADKMGITQIYQQYNEMMKEGLAWQEEWRKDEPDPKKLESLAYDYISYMETMGEKIGNFEKWYLEDAKREDKDRQIYQITNHKDVDRGDLIASEEEFQDDTRAVNGRNWKDHQTSFQAQMEREILAAKLMQLKKGLTGKESEDLRDDMDTLIEDCLRERKNKKGLSFDERFQFLSAVQEGAAKLAKKGNPTAQSVLEAVEAYRSQRAVKDCELKNGETMNADKWVEHFQQKGSLERIGNEGKTVVDTDQLINIMAVRMLSGSVRGKKKTLQKPIDGAAIAQKAAELRADPTCQSFLQDLDRDPKAMKRAVSAAKSGHGGALEDMFKKHVKELPPGELANNSLLQRYMPTAKERIEYLQSYADNHLGDTQKIIGEIIVLRNLVHAERGKSSSLKKPIPTDTKGSLQETAQSLHLSITLGANSYQMSHDRNITDLIVRGHGGELTEYFREHTPSSILIGNADKDKVDEILNQNTFKGRMTQLKAEAKQLREQAAETGHTPEAKQRARELLSEYLVLESMTRDRKDPNEVDYDKMYQDVPWSKVEKAAEKGFTKEPDFTRITDKMGDDLLTTVLEDMEKKDQVTFADELGAKMADIRKDLHKQPTVEKTVQHTREADRSKQNQGSEIT